MKYEVPALRYGLDIIAYNSYKRFCLAYHKANTIHSWSWLAKRVGAGVRRGTVHRNITSEGSRPPEEHIGHYAYAFGLKHRREDPDNDYSQYFRYLYKYEHAEDPETRNLWRAKIEAARLNRQIRRPSNVQARLFAHWSIPAIAEMTHHPEFSADPEWIAARLFPPVSVAQAEHAVSELLSLGFFEYSLDSERLVPPKSTLLIEVDVANRPESPDDAIDALQAWYADRASALATHPQMPRDERYFRAVNVAMPEAALDEAKALIQEVATRLVAIQDKALQQGHPPGRVHCMAVHLMPVSLDLTDPTTDPIAAAGASRGSDPPPLE